MAKRGGFGRKFLSGCKKALDKFKKETLEKRTLDYLRQTLIFNYIYKNTDYFKNVKYLFLDDGDEITPVCFDFIGFLKPQLKQVFIGYDKKGSTRLGYLSADKTAVSEFETMFEEKPKIQKSKSKLKSKFNSKFKFKCTFKNKSKFK